MKRTALWILLALTLSAPAWAQQPAAGQAAANPLLKEWATPFGVPPFQEIKPEHFLPAFKQAIAAQRQEIEAIVNNPQAPTFENTIAALDKAGELMAKVSGVFSNLQSAETTPELQAVNREVTPLRTALSDDIRLDPKLFARIKAVWEDRDKAKLTPEQKRLVEDTYKGYVRSGANLNAEQKDRLRKINAETSMLTLKFGDNLLHDTNAYRLVVDKQEDLAGLPPSVVSAASDAAKAAKMPGKWVFTLQAPSIWPFLQASAKRELREQILKAYISKCDHNDEWDNKAIITKIIGLRVERANLLGYKSHADFVLEENMAKTPDKVYALLNQIWGPARATVEDQKPMLLDVARKEGGPTTLEPWDWRYYAEKVKKAKYDVDQETTRPYFKLENVMEGVFYVAKQLYGITFIPRPDLPVYNPEVKAFEVHDADGSLLAVYYADYHPRPGKRVGAWSSSFRSQKTVNGKRTVAPIVVNVCNFSRATGDMPALLSIEEVSTLFHEFGHALNSMFSRVPYRGLGATPRDFVELPSQIMENWATEPDVLKVYAKHYKTGEVIPTALVDKIHKASQWDEAFNQVEYLAASLLDMDWHTQLPAPTDPTAFENQSMAKIHDPKEIVPRYRSPYFNHIWASGYSAGYYSYIWCQVLDADAFQAFKEKGNLFDKATATSFRKNILEKGGSEDVMTLYKAYRGREPKVDALLARLGFKTKASN
ncbi:MAG: M3 family metallopeptidase [Bacteroidales bacterium]